MGDSAVGWCKKTLRWQSDRGEAHVFQARDFLAYFRQVAVFPYDGVAIPGDGRVLPAATAPSAYRKRRRAKRILIVHGLRLSILRAQRRSQQIATLKGAFPFER